MGSCRGVTTILRRHTWTVTVENLSFSYFIVFVWFFFFFLTSFLHFFALFSVVRVPPHTPHDRPRCCSFLHDVGLVLSHTHGEMTRRVGRNIKTRFRPDPRDRDLYAHTRGTRTKERWHPTLGGGGGGGWPLASSRASIFTLFRFFFFAASARFAGHLHKRGRYKITF